MIATLGIDTGVKVKPSAAPIASSPLSVGDLARLTGASPRSLRHYDGLGLLPSSRTANGYRSFGDHAVAAVGRIRALLDAGYNLQLVARLLDCSTADGDIDLCPEVAAQMRAVLERKDAEIRRLRAEAELIRAHLAR